MFTCTNGTISLQQFLPYRLTTLANRISQSLAKKYQTQFGISVSEWRIIAVLGEKRKASAVEITQTIAMDKVSVSRAVKKLLTKHIVDKVVSKTDSRSYDLQLTEQGQDLYQQLVPIAIEHQRLALREFSADEQRLLANLLTKLDNSRATDYLTEKNEY
ncbi:MarR family winged helix-turn-helix transcriptional regulator [Thalassotalea ponticola]|uniref:MarR family winged helix-turn-helix transcriptional regulator n=1 Tax=Thalassotalea ponticola TaxID=1523392 RepID=UPI0025B6101B|nr:MarR family winged helix-turn-helix transcriptional regulator [Thalassotalea ponticola]MDN3652960.1 MarR family winged helix-turn-helix transcriptional regulator [Thalassotalea ponticola]